MALVMSSGYVTLDGTVQSLAILAPSMVTEPSGRLITGFQVLSFWAPDDSSTGNSNAGKVYVGCSSLLNPTTGVGLYRAMSPGQGCYIEVKSGNPIDLGEWYVKGSVGDKVLVTGLRT